MKRGKELYQGEAIKAAEKIMATIRKDCERVELAGSLRCKGASGSAIDLVGIVKSVPDLWGHEHRPAIWIRDDLMRAGYKIQIYNDNFVRFLVSIRGGTELIPCELWLTMPEFWGVALALRTGPMTFSHRLLMGKQNGGLLPDGMRIEGNLLIRDDQVLIIRTEEEFFAAIGLNYIDPEKRGGFDPIPVNTGIAERMVSNAIR
jgi:DNA polymerase/3'-5' exonuclease PolX